MATDTVNARGVKFASLPNQAAIEYLRSKIPAASAHWDDWIAPVHAKSFTVAGAPSVEFAADMHAAITKAIAQGTTIAEFRKDFDKIVQQYGWTYKGKRGWRTSVIYNTNMRTARMAAKWQTIQDNKDVAPFLEYRAVNDNRTRQQHKAWDGTIRHVDDAFWDTHYPPNGWGCRCTVVQMSGATMARQGKTVSDAPDIQRGDVPIVRDGQRHVIENQPAGIDVGWDSNVGQSWLAPDIALGKKLAAMPPNMAGHAYQLMVTKPFIEALDGSWKNFVQKLRLTTRKQNKQQFIGFIRNDLQVTLREKTDEIIAESKAFNLKNDARRQVDVPTSLNAENYAITAPDFKIDHFGGDHRKGVNPHDWPDEWILELPSLMHDSKYVFYDISGQTIGYLTKNSKMVKGKLRYGVLYVRLNQSKGRMQTSNWVVSLNTKHLSDLKNDTIDLIGHIPEK